MDKKEWRKNVDKAQEHFYLKIKEIETRLNYIESNALTQDEGVKSIGKGKALSLFERIELLERSIEAEQENSDG